MLDFNMKVWQSAPLDCGEYQTHRLVVTSIDIDSISGQIFTAVNESEVYTATGNPAWSYQWDITGGQIVNGQGTATVEVSWDSIGAGTLSVIAMNQAGCMSPPQVLQVMVGPPTGLEPSLANWLTWELYPNPGRDAISILIEATQKADVDFVVVDMLGREIHREKGGRLAVGESRLRLSCSNWPSGLYQVVLRSGDAHSLKKLILR